MAYLYLTPNLIGEESGVGHVTQQESTVLRELAARHGEEFLCWGEKELKGVGGEDPWKWDPQASTRCWEYLATHRRQSIRLAHIYSGIFPNTIDLLRKQDCKVTYTASAHDLEKSKLAHDAAGVPVQFRKLLSPELLQIFRDSYRNVNLVICPSQHSANCVRAYGYENIEVIPHGVDLPDTYTPANSQGGPCNVGYLGAVGADKGLRYLLEAWKLLNLNAQDAVLILAGTNSTCLFLVDLIQKVLGKGPIRVQQGKFFNLVSPDGHAHVYLTGWVPQVSMFYNHISFYVQPSMTESFGLEVLEAMSYGRSVICSDGAGAADVVPPGWRVPAGDVHALANHIEGFRHSDLAGMGHIARELAEEYTWTKISGHYQELWEKLL